MESSAEVWNEQQLIEVVEDDVEMMRELIELFFSDAEQRVHLISQAVEGGDCELVQREAHAVKGASGNFGAERLYHAAMSLEHCGTGNDLDGCLEALDRVRKELKELMVHVNARVTR